ncbi:hypothetical protein [Thalassolituus sp. C2-1]|uniref:hypothetical protein n=1 Tax=Venatorbacter sp. C2-1 TaxID=2597518 RepID=UPI001196C96D|nr:hypothetical protein [Thalassolituus sp. C2-1]TVV41945.1 hypothetical protein FOT50_18315 [Thalassolituus sp. C2-1]
MVTRNLSGVSPQLLAIVFLIAALRPAGLLAAEAPGQEGSNPAAPAAENCNKNLIMKQLISVQLTDDLSRDAGKTEAFNYFFTGNQLTEDWKGSITAWQETPKVVGTCLNNEDYLSVVDILDYVRKIKAISAVAITHEGAPELLAAQLKVIVDHVWRNTFSALAVAGQAGNYMTAQEFSELLNMVPANQAKQYEEKNEAWFAAVSKLASYEARQRLQAKRKQLDSLLQKQLYSILTPTDEISLKELLQDQEVISSDVIDIPLSGYKDYPLVVSRFTLGAVFTSTEKLAGEANPTAGYLYYRQPNSSDLSGYHFGNELLLTSIKTSEENTSYSLRMGQLVYRALGSSQAGNQQNNLTHGIALDLGGYVYENEDDSLVYLAEAYLGYRAAYSPEQYTELMIGQCRRLASDGPKCYPRVKANLKIVVPGFNEQDKTQLGLELSYKTTEDDVLGNSVSFTVRYNTSFGDLYQSLSR